MTTENIRNYPAAARAIDAGAASQDVQTAMAAAAYEAIFGTLYDLTEDPDEFKALAASGTIDGSTSLCSPQTQPASMVLTCSADIGLRPTLPHCGTGAPSDGSPGGSAKPRRAPS